MHIQIMTASDCMTFILGQRTGRLACSNNDRPYVVPVRYVCSGRSIYSFSMPGQKLDFMRSNPRVCFEVDSIQDATTWTCAVIEGTFYEMTSLESQQEAWQILQQHNDWWEVGSQPVDGTSRDEQPKPIFFSISMDAISGRQAGSRQ